MIEGSYFKIGFLASLLVNTLLCALMLLQSKEYKESNNMWKEYSVSLENVIMSNAQFMLDFSKSDFEPFQQLTSVMLPEIVDYCGVIIPSSPCQVCISHLLDVLDQKTAQECGTIIIFLPMAFMKDFTAHFANIDEVHLISYDIDAIPYMKFSGYDELVIYNSVSNELINFFKTFKQFPNLLNIII